MKSVTLNNKNIIPSKRDSPDETMSIQDTSNHSESSLTIDAEKQAFMQMKIREFEEQYKMYKH